MGIAAGFAAVAPNPNKVAAPNAGAGADGAGAGAGANDGVAVVAGTDAPNANDGGVLVLAGAPNPPSGATFAVDGAAPENIVKFTLC